MSRMTNPETVRAEYATEAGLATRNRIYRDYLEGPYADDEVFRRIAERKPRKVLEVGCGTGELAARISAETSADVVAIDLSPRMIELARSRGVDASVADVQQLPFENGSFDCIVAAWMLYHAPELDCALSEIARVLDAAGFLVASTTRVDNYAEVWELVGLRPRPTSFSDLNGDDALRRHFASVRRQDVDAVNLFPDSNAIREFLLATISWKEYASRVPELDGPFRARTTQVVWVAEGPLTRHLPAAQ